MEPAATRKTKSFDALKAVHDDSDLFVAVSKIFWGENKKEKTRKWLTKAITLNKDNGDAWAHLYKFEKDIGNE
jgi:pre-mRNA-processing factor 6